MKKYIDEIKNMKQFLLLWSTQAFSALGSAMTSYALVIWSYTQEGSALITALLMVCSYAPYVLLSIFAGALSDRWSKKRTMLFCDLMAALTTFTVLFLLKTGRLVIWHLYAINAVNGLMNTVQQPASEVATTLVLPKENYQRAGGLKALSNSVNSILTPILATAIMGLLGIDAVIVFDIVTFLAAFTVLLFFIKIPDEEKREESKTHVFTAAKEGIAWLRKNRGIFDLILFLAAINLVASMYNAAFPAMMISRQGGSEFAMGVVNTVIGVGSLLGGIAASVMKAPKSRVKMVCNTLLISMSTENFLLALGRSLPVWCIGGFLGWFLIPIMNANLGAVMRLNIPKEIQGRVYACRNSLQFFTIPLGYFLGGFLVDNVFEPFMAQRSINSLFIRLFGSGKGSGAALFFFFIAFLGVAVCLYFRRSPHIRALEESELKGGTDI